MAVRLHRHGFGLTKFIGSVEVNRLSARSAFIYIVVCATCVIAAAAMIGGGLLFGELKRAASEQQSEILAKSAQASLHNDLLSSNTLLAADRLRSMIVNTNAFCISVTPLNTRLSSRIQVGVEAICGNAAFRASNRVISFDGAGQEPAFRISVKSDPDMLGFHLSTKVKWILSLFLFTTCTLLIVLSLFADSVLSKIFMIIREGGLDHVKGFYLEHMAINDLIIEKNVQSVIAEQSLSRAREAEALTSLARQVSHDIRSPLAALNALLKYLPDMDAAKRDITRHAIQRISGIANDLLRTSNGSRTQSAAVMNALSLPVSITKLINLVVAEKMELHRADSWLALSVECGDNCQVLVSLDELKFSRTLSNLINNAIESLVGSGSVTITLARYGHATVDLSISDTGRGIPPRVLAQIGERGFSYDKSGTGLGVAYAKELMAEIGGKFTLESRVGTGTRVTLSLPVFDADRI